MVTLGIMLAGIAVGRFFPERHKAKNEWAQLAFTLLLIFSMGVGLGQREGFFSELAVLGLRSFLLFLLPTLCSVAVVYVLTRCCMGEGAAVRETAGGRQESAPVQMGSDPMVFFALGALLLGMVCGAFPACAAVLSPLTAHTQWLLYALMFSVGVSVGLRRGLLESIRKYHMRILVIPCGIIAGSLLGGLLCGLLMAYPVNQTVSVAAGLGWYSFAGVSIGNLAGAELGSIAFLSNLMREIGAFFMIPYLARRLNYFTCIAPAAATSEDTTLPMLIRHTNEETVVFAVINGILCSAAVPVLIALCY
ncbi:MAG: lysine exporter LysO family protein [Agathobaculum desmolans]|uniref:lysine exporter LysO family protein n=1 Tax=Agathobaculum desmolans TaxID=39484 RepID=UPI003994800C